MARNDAPPGTRTTELLPPLPAELVEALAASGVGYVISATPTYKISDPRSSAYPGLDDLDGVPGFELLAREGDAELFRITACLPDHVVDS